MNKLKYKSGNLNHEYGLIFGLIVGDALGVPYEFIEQDEMKLHPFKGEMVGYGSHMQPIGTWSDDSSLALCLLETIIEGYDLNKLGEKFIKWLYEGYWTPHGKVFDCGFTVRKAIESLSVKMPPSKSGEKDVWSNGNGSLMRLAPLLFIYEKVNLDKRFELVSEVSAITHGHIRSILACYYYMEFLVCLSKGYKKEVAYTLTNLIFTDFTLSQKIGESEIKHFRKILSGNLTKKGTQVSGTGYVIHSLEAALWCFLTTDNFKDCVSAAINLGDDTDSTAAIAGALAGYFYGFKSIKKKWVNSLAKKEEIFNLCEKHINLKQDAFFNSR